MVKRLFRVVKSASNVVKAAYEAGKYIVQTVQISRRTISEQIISDEAFFEGSEDNIPLDSSALAPASRQTPPLPENLQRILPMQAAQLAACNQAFREGVMLLWRQNLEDDLFWQAVEDLYSRYTAERSRLGVSLPTTNATTVSILKGIPKKPGKVIKGSC